MRAKATLSPRPPIALVVGLVLGAAISTAAPARADVAAGQAQPPALQTAGTPQAGTDFVCHAEPGGWCDLRDWSGTDRWPVTPQSQVPN